MIQGLSITELKRHCGHGGDSPKPQHIHDQLIAVEELEELIEDELKEAVHPEGNLVGAYVVQSLGCFGRCEPLHDITITCISNAQRKAFGPDALQSL